MIVQKKQIQAVEFNGDNFDEIKLIFPQLEKFTHREEYHYTVGWKFEDPTFGPSFTEALPGFLLIKNDGPDKILTPDQFKAEYE